MNMDVLDRFKTKLHTREVLLASCVVLLVLGKLSYSELVSSLINDTLDYLLDTNVYHVSVLFCSTSMGGIIIYLILIYHLSIRLSH